MQCVRPVVDLVPNVAKLRFEIVPGGHLGMLTGRAARTTTWRILDEWISENASDTHTTGSTTKSGRAARTPAGRKPAKKAAPRKAPAKKAAAGGDGARPKPAKKAAPRKDAIGSNPDRRYGSGSSRSLATKK